MADIFDKPEQVRGPAFVAPGLPATALSGNPAATVTNLAAVGGAQRGGAIAAAIGAAINGPQVDPVALSQARQEAFLAEVTEAQARGEFLGDALLQAAQSNRAGLSAQERLRALAQGQDIREKELAEFNRITDSVLKSDEVSNFRIAHNNFQQMIDAAKEGGLGNDLLLIKFGLKAMAPDEAITDGEFDAAEAAASGRINFSLYGISDEDVRAIVQRGKKATLRREQKQRWLQAVEKAVQSRQAAAEQVLVDGLRAGQARNISTVKLESAFKAIDSLMRNRDGELIDRSAQLAAAVPDFAQGTDSGDPVADFARFPQELPKILGDITSGIFNGIKDGALPDVFKRLGTKPSKKQVQDAARELQKAFRLRSWDSTRIEQGIRAHRYGTGNDMHNRILSALDGTDDILSGIRDQILNS